MIREPNGTTDVFTQNKSEQRSGEENKRTGQIVDRKRRQKSMQ